MALAAARLRAAPAGPAALADGDRSADADLAGGGFWLQFGAFRQRDGAQALQEQLRRQTAADPLPGLALRDAGAWVRVQAGPWASRAAALAAADRLLHVTGLRATLLQEDPR